jgi:hypothetical protein
MTMLIDLLWLSVLAYMVLQIVVIWRSSGFARWIAALPVVIMVPIFILTAMALLQDSNPWPLLLLFASPVALLYVAVVALFVLTRKNATLTSWAA